MTYQWGKRNNSHGNNSDQDRPNQFASRPFSVPTKREQETAEPRKLPDESSQLRLSSITRPDPTVQPQSSDTEQETEEQKQESKDTIKQQSPSNPEQPNNNTTNPTATIQTKLTIGEPGDKYEQ
ncbi:MAG TPA: hypothetical protein VK184_19270 [Nostocaceae cyanobacterium]|nr:hypothetical protein [Nostocaceae cyanobacterium]